MSTVERKTARHADMTLEVEQSGTEPSGVLRCQACRTANPAARKFCAHCGAHLWEPCLLCGTMAASGELFCGSCGADLEANLAARRQQCVAELAQADQLQAAASFDQAIELLSGITRLKHPRLEPFVRQANQQLKDLMTLREQRRQETVKLVETAQQQFNWHDYAAVAATIEQIPAPLRDATAVKLLTDAQSRQAEVAQLKQQLRDGVARKQYQGLLEHAARLLELDDSYAPARKLAEQLQERICRTARERIAAQQYEAAWRLVDRVPESVRTDATRQCQDEVSELGWMATELRTAPHVDGVLVDVAARLCKLAPGDVRFAKLAAEVRRRAARLNGTAALTPVAWAAPAPANALGVPVEWLTNPQRFPFRDNVDRKPFCDEAGGYFAACGLALQGIGRSVVSVNFLPTEYRGTMIGHFNRMVRWSTVRSAWGIDFGSSGIKALRLVWDPRQQHAEITAGRFVAFPKPLNQAANETEENRLLDEAIAELLSAGQMRGDRICLGFPSRGLLFRTLRLPPAEAAKLDALVENEVRSDSPVPLDQLVWDYLPLEDLKAPAAAASPAAETGKSAEAEKAAAEKAPRDILFFAVKQAQVMRLLSRFQAAGLNVDAVQADALALYNAMFHERFIAPAGESPPPEPPAPVAVLDFGGDTTTLLACGPGTLWFRNFGVGGQSVSRAIVHQLQISFAEAEELKRHPQKSSLFSRLYRAIDPVFEQLVGEIETALGSFRKAYPHAKLSRLFALGGGMRLHGALRYLRAPRSEP